MTSGAAFAAPQKDQVFRTDPRTGKVRAMTGVVQSNELERVVLERGDGKEARYDSSEVVEIVFGDVPPAFRDAKRYMKRGDLENAVARYRVAASDASARPVVQAKARLLASEALLSWGATDATRFAEAAQEAAQFISDYGTNRALPRARAVQGRALWLSGDAAGAAAALQSLFQDGQSGAAGYPAVVSMQAGIDAAFAFLDAGDGDSARAAFDAVAAAAPGVTTDGLPTADVVRIEGLTEIASLAQGFVNLADGAYGRATSFFSGKVDGMKTGAGKTAARLGHGEGLLGEAKFRAAQLALAEASALAYANQDLEARAMVGLGRAAAGAGDASTAKKQYELVQTVHGATPSAAKAAELLQSL